MLFSNLSPRLLLKYVPLESVHSRKKKSVEKTIDLGICNTKNVFNPFTIRRGSNDIANCWLKLHFIEKVNLTSQQIGGLPKIFRIFCQFLHILSNERVTRCTHKKMGPEKENMRTEIGNRLKGRFSWRAAIEKIKLSYTDN